MYFADDAMDDLFYEDIDEAVYPVVRTVRGRLRVDRSRNIENNRQALRSAISPNRAGVWVEGSRKNAKRIARHVGFPNSIRHDPHRRRDGTFGQPHIHGVRKQSPPRSSHIFYGSVPPGDFADYDAFEDVMVDAMESEDTDEFFRRLVRGIGRVARGIGRGIGRVARVIAPIASAIPLPWTQAIGRVAQVAGRLMADGADEFEAIDALVDLAEAEDLWDAAAPAIATMAVHGTMPQSARLPTAMRQQLLRATTRTAQTLARQQGTQSVRILPAIIQTAQRVARQQGLMPQALPQVIQRIGVRLSHNPQMVRRLLRSSSPALRQSICTACSHSGR